MEVRVVGPLEIVGEAGTVVLAPKERVVVARLALARGGPVDDAALHDALWPRDPPRTATKTTAGYVHRLRQVLGADVIVRRPRGYAINVAAVSLDVVRIDETVAAARTAVASGDLVAAGRDFRDVVRRFRGVPYVELDGVDHVLAERGRLDELRACVEEELHDVLLAGGEAATLVPHIEAFVARDPTRERAWAQLMTAYARSGRQAAALDAYARARRILATELGLEPGPQLQRLHQQVLAHDEHVFGSAREAGPGPPVGPPDLIGRDQDVAAIHAALARNRLVTLVGMGGAGKTRLAQHVLAQSGHVRTVELAPVSADGVAGAFQRTLGVGEQPGRSTIDAVASWCGDRDELIVVDNCEHVVATVAALVADLLRACPRLRVLATSRERLRIRDEQVIVVEPLPTPISDADVESSAAVELFVRLATSVGAPVDLRDRRERAAVATVCRRLDGLPLALELGAAQLRTRSVVELCDDLGALDLAPRDVPRRQRSLDELVAWSEQLLAPAAVAALRRLSVFPGDFDTSAARAVVRGEPVAEGGELSALASLVEASLVVVRRRTGEAHRYRLLDTVRRHATRRLDEHGEQARTKDALLAWAVDIVATIELDVRTPRQDTAMKIAAREHLNIAAACEHALAGGDHGAALRLVATVPTVPPADRRRLLSRLVAIAMVPPELRARAWLTLANLASDVGDVGDQAGAAMQALDAAIEAGDEFQAAWSRYFVVLGLWGTDRLEGISDLVENATAGFRSIGSAHGVASMTWISSLLEPDLDVAESLAARAVAEFRDLGLGSGLAHALEGRALIAMRAGDGPTVRACLGEAVAIVAAANNGGCTAHCVESVAAYAVECGRTEEARQLAAAAAALRDATGHGMRVWEREGHRRVVAALGEAAVIAVRGGSDISVGEAAMLAQQVLAGGPD